MARIPTQQRVIEIGESANPHDGGERSLASDEARPNVLPDAPPPEIRKFVVTKGGRITTPDGYMTRLHEGKILDDHNYNLDRLRQQGIRLAAYVEEG